MKQFKKRMIILDYVLCKMGGIRTFIEHYIPILEDNEVVIDYINVFNNKECVEYFTKKFPNNLNIIDVRTDYPELNREHQYFKNEMTFFSTSAHDPVLEYMVIKKMFQLMNKNIYDFILINHHEVLGAVTGIFPFSKAVRTFAYTHCAHTYTDATVYKGTTEDVFSNYNTQCLLYDTSVEIISQKRNSYVSDTFPNHTNKVIGMPLDVTKFHKYFDPSVKEDAVLYVGRAYQPAKNIEGWVKHVSKTDLKAYVVVPNKAGADTFIKLFEKSNFTNYEVFYDITFEKKMEISAKCKVFYISSFTENFAFTIYENLNLMKVVSTTRQWSTEVKEVLDDIIMTTDDNAHIDIMKAVREYKDEDVVRQYNFLLDYNKQIAIDWKNYLNSPGLYDSLDKKEVKVIEHLNNKHSLSEALASMGRPSLALTELVTLYRNIDMSKVIQTKDESFYGEIPNENKHTKDIDEWF